ncbi:MAG TPA: twin-arginine translocation signal domain-containing protein, partial [Xanthobacteraceae bacterium]|nr:twin-arginine translocation signal domain-containing protein [Xanthobacteraceae bacterium]
MSQNRRTFLRTTALAGAAAAGAGLAAPALAQRTAAPTTGAQQLPRDLTLATLRRAGGYGLGVRSERGILDVTAAEQEFRENAPTTIEALLRGERDANSLKRL